jgi:signal transduction histidine kinase
MEKSDMEITDAGLIAELRRRFEENKKRLLELKGLTVKLEEMNIKLLESESMKSHFLSNIRNEVNNPLASIIGAARKLATGGVDRTVVQEIAGTVYMEAFNLEFQLRNIYAAAEIEAGEATLSIARVDIKRLIDALVAEFMQFIGRKRLRVQDLWPTGDENIIFPTDPGKLQLILSNMLSNAIEYNKDEGYVTIETGVYDDNLVMKISNSGEGLDEQAQELIFERFRQLEEGVQKRQTDQGLGLSVVKSLVDLLHGKITLVSRKGAETSFLFIIPPLQSAEEACAFSLDGSEFIFDVDDGGIELF